MRNGVRKTLLWITSIASISFLAIFFLLPFLLTFENPWHISYESTGEIGDTFGGVLGPIVGFAGALSAFIAFYIQYRSNRSQNRQFRRQAKDSAIQKFESIFFELVKIHRENTSNMSIGTAGGRAALSLLLEELNFILEIIKFLVDDPEENLTWSKSDCVDIAFGMVYIGVKINNQDDLNYYLRRFDADQISRLLTIIASNDPKKRTIEIKDPSDRNQVSASYGFEHDILTGCSNQLGPYFRHLWTTVNFLESQSVELLTDDEKYAYSKILRAQISNHEQILLHYNALTQLGSVWLQDKKLLIKYRLTKNMPRNLCKFGPGLDSIYPTEGYFEY